MTATDQLASKLLEIINQVQTGVIAHAPEAMNIILSTVRVDAFGNFLSAFIGIVIVFIFYKIYLKMKHLRNSDDLDDLYWAYTILGTVISGLIIIGGLMQFFDIWQYVAIFNPKLYLAHEIIQKVMK